MRNGNRLGRIVALALAGLLLMGWVPEQARAQPAEVPPAEKPGATSPSPDTSKEGPKSVAPKAKPSARAKQPPPVKVATVVSASNSLQHEAPCDRCKGSGKETKSKAGSPRHVAPGVSQRDSVLFSATCDACEGCKVDKADKMGYIIKDLMGALDKVDTQQKEWNDRVDQIGHNLTKAATISITGWAQRLQENRLKVQAKEFKEGDAVLLAGVVESDEGADAQRVLTIRIGSAIKFGSIDGVERWHMVQDASMSTIKLIGPRIVKAGAGSPVLFGGTAVRDSDGSVFLRQGFAVRGN